MIPRAITALADEPPPSALNHGGLGLVAALAIAAVAIAGGLWLARRRAR